MYVKVTKGGETLWNNRLSFRRVLYFGPGNYGIIKQRGINDHVLFRFSVLNIFK